MTGVYWLPPTTAPVICGAAEHVLRWADGELTALNHDDIDGELALGALGGELTGCPQIVGAWRTAVQDPRLLTLASRGKSDQLDPQPHGGFAGFSTLGALGGGPMRRPRGMRRAGSAQLIASAVPAPFPMFARAAFGTPAVATSTFWGSGDPVQTDPLVRLLQLPGVGDRLIYCAVTGWASRLAAGTVRTDAVPTLTAALISRVRCAIRDWLGNPNAAVEVEMLPPVTRPTLAIEADGTLRVGMPFGWLASVWATELSTIYGRFTLAAEMVGRTVTLDTVGPDLTRAPIVIRLP